MINKGLLILSCCLFFVLANSFAQQVPEKAMAAYYKAKDFGSRTQWEEAIDALNVAIRLYPKYTQAKELLGEYQYLLRQNEAAIATLESCSGEPDFSARATFLLSEIYLKVRNSEKAKLYADRYLSLKDKAPGASRKAEQTVLNASFSIEAKKNPVPFQPKNLGEGINTKDLEYFPYLTPDGKLLAFTRLINNQEDIFVAQKTDTGFSKAISLGNIINTYQNEGAESMNADATILFFTACNRQDGLGSCDLYFSQKLNNRWTRPMGIGVPINSGAWEAQPSFSSDGKSLYFSSNRSGGYGGKDIWVSYLDDQLRWSEPENLGPNVNTLFDDQCPFIHADNQTLYFTSNGWPGIGDGDVFISRKVDTGWTKAENLGYPINTENNDNGLTVSYDGKTAFLSSARDSGFGGLDIYSFGLPKNIQPQLITYIRAMVMDASTKQLLNASYTIVDLETGREVYKGVALNGNFFLSIKANRNYAFQIQKEKYLFYSQNINLKEASELRPYELNVLLEPILSNSKVILNNVFFDFDKSELNSASFMELDKVVELLQKNPAIRIEISGHTDDKGDVKYNQALSQKRAESVVNYLVQKGVAKLRLIAKGYGEEQPIISNDTEEHKAMNRRTEMKVL